MNNNHRFTRQPARMCRARKLLRAAIANLAGGVAIAAAATLARRAAPGGNPEPPAEFTVTTNVLRGAEKVPPLGANDFGRCGAVEWAANNFVHNSGNEPIYWRNLHRAARVGPNWFEPDGPGTSRYALWNSGFSSGSPTCGSTGWSTATASRFRSMPKAITWNSTGPITWCWWAKPASWPKEAPDSPTAVGLPTPILPSIRIAGSVTAT